MTAPAKKAGQPLVVLAALLVGWCGARVMAWESPVSAAAARESFSAARGEYPRADGLPAMAGPQNLAYAGYPGYYAGPGANPFAAMPLRMGRSGSLASLTRHPTLTGTGSMPIGGSFEDYVIGDFPGIDAGSRSGSSAAGRTALAAQPYPDTVARSTPPTGEIARAARRWSADAWAFLRSGDSTGLANGQIPATYGASQAGAVLRYRIRSMSRIRPEIYLRTTSTLGMVQESAAALGLAARPLAGVPVATGLEVRVTEQAGDRRVQPAIIAVSEFPAFTLPGRMRGEAYAQAGYVGGKFATPFADGLVHADREVFGFGKVHARLGAGAWAGFQEGASRVDLGPSANLTMPLGKETYGRVALDWRFRLAGNAEPDSGPSVTLSAGF